MAQVRKHTGLLKAIQDHVPFARARFGHYDTIDFVVVLIGYALSGEPTLKAFYERLLPFAEAFMALFDRHPSPLGRHFLAFWQPWIKRPWRLCERSFKQIWWREPLSPLPAACGIVSTSSMSSWM